MSWREEWLENLGVVLAAWSWGQQPLLHRKWRRWLLLAKPPPGLAHCFPLWETSGGPFPLSPIVPPSPANLGGERHTLAAEPSRPRPQSKKQRQWSDGKQTRRQCLWTKSSHNICSSILPYCLLSMLVKKNRDLSLWKNPKHRGGQFRGFQTTMIKWGEGGRSRGSSAAPKVRVFYEKKDPQHTLFCQET